MRYRQIITEVPISDIQPMGDPDPEIDQDYADEDEGMYKAWTEPEKRDWLSDMPKAKKWRSGVVQSWSKTKNNYEVQKEFKDRILKKDKKSNIFFKTIKNKTYFSLNNYVYNQLEQKGISNLELINKDTFDKKNNFFSARRSIYNKQADYGRNISIIMIK